MSFDPAIRTRTLARIIGPYFIVIGATMFARQHTFATLLPDFMQNASLVLATGAFTLMIGLVIITAHHHWNNASAIVISFVGVAAALKGAWLMVTPDLGAEATAAFVSAPAAMLAAAAFEILIGAWLTFVGWFAKSV